MVMFGVNLHLRAATITWTNTATSGTLLWSTPSNWSPNAVPTSADDAVLENSTYAYIDFTGSNPQSVGSITVSPNRVGANAVLRQQSGSAALVVYGINGVLITNASTAKRLQVAQGGVTAPTL
jgi:hypothetical protein